MKMLRFPRSGEAGFTLVTALILLIMVTLVVVMSFNLSQSNAVVVGNFQHRTEALNAANHAIGTIINSAGFVSAPASPIPAPQQCGAGNKFCVDSDGDGNTDYNVTVAATCMKVRVIRNSELSLTNANDVPCVLGQAQNVGVVGALTGESLCADSTWQIDAKADDTTTATTLTASQGVSLRITRDDAVSACP